MKKDARLIAELSVLSLSLLVIVSQLSLSKGPSDAIAQFSYYTLQTNLIILVVAFAISYSTEDAKSHLEPTKYYKS